MYKYLRSSRDFSFAHILNLTKNYLGGFLKLSNDDIILTSFPKSGNTWVRFFIYIILSNKYKKDEVPSFEELDKKMPALGVKSMFEE
jgi:hypothetical protein